MKKSDFEKAKAARMAILTRWAGVYVYRNWSDDFSVSEITRDLPDSMMGVDPWNLTKSEMLDLGFGRWNDKSELMLIPLWMYPLLKNDVRTIAISGEEYHKKSDINTDSRFGCLAYGVYPKDEAEVPEIKYDKVTYVPPHAKGNAGHPDAEQGVLIRKSSDGETAMVLFCKSRTIQQCQTKDLVEG